MTKIAGLFLTALLLTTAGVVHADVSKAVEKAFKGKIIISAQPLPPPGETDTETIRVFKKAHAKSIPSTESEGTSEWEFFFTAFLSKAPKIDALSLDFYTTDKEKLFVADKRFTGIDGKATVLSSQVTISEDDGIAKGKSYLVKLTGKVGSKNVTFAQANITMK